MVDDDDRDAAIDAWTLVGLGGLLVGCVVAGLVLGLLADRHWHSAPAGILIGLGLGVVAGVVGSFVQISSYLRS